MSGVLISTAKRQCFVNSKQHFQPMRKPERNVSFFHRDRSRFIATRGILRELLGGYVNLAPGHLEFDYGPQGKPTLRTALPQQSVQFNVSHSHGVALLAFSVGRRLGVDVELVRSFRGP